MVPKVIAPLKFDCIINATVREGGFHPFPAENGYRKNNYIVDYLDLIESHFPLVIFPNGKWVTGELCFVSLLVFSKKNESEPNGAATFFRNKSEWKWIRARLFKASLA